MLVFDKKKSNEDCIQKPNISLYNGFAPFGDR